MSCKKKKSDYIIVEPYFRILRGEMRQLAPLFLDLFFSLSLWSHLRVIPSAVPILTIHHPKYLARSLANFKGLFPGMNPLCQVH